MKRLTATVFLLLAAAAPLHADSLSPHHMVKPDGEVDMEKCGFCHEADMSLSRSKRETCTLCHSETIHAGAWQHLRAKPARVTALIGPAGADKPALPRREDGGIFCGTCHEFHDPAIGGALLAHGWLPPAKGLAEAVRMGVLSQWKDIAQKYEASGPEAKFATQATRALRLPVDDGSLCRHCHGQMK